MKAIVSMPPAGRGDSITRAAAAAAIAAATGGSATATCARLFPRDKLAAVFVARDATLLGTSGGWGAPLVVDGVRQFLEGLAPHSAIARLMPEGLVAIGDAPGSFPCRSGNPAQYSLVVEGAPIPVRSATLASVDLTQAKVGGIVCVSRALAKHGNGVEIIATLVREDAGRSLDGAYLSTATDGLLHGVSAIAPSTDWDNEALRADLAAVASAAATNGSGSVTLIMSPARFARVRVRAPDLGLTVLPSIAVPDSRIVAVDGAGLVHGFGPAPEIDASEAAALHMSDAPAEIVSGTGPTTAAPVRSLFQTTAIGVRCILDVAFGKRSPTCVAYVDGPFNW